MDGRSDWSRRRWLRTLAGSGLATLLDAFMPRAPYAAQVTKEFTTTARDAQTFDLTIAPHMIELAGRHGDGLAVNGALPGPLLEWQEGRDVVIDVHNALAESSSLHWHGILLPFEMDGVPGVTFRGIAPGTSFCYAFPVCQSGTYWYHSHSGMQEQRGVYGPLVIHPRTPDPNHCDKDYVVVLSDWTFESPHVVMRNLKKMSDYYNYQQYSLAAGYGVAQMSAGDALATKIAWDRMRMMATDIADVSGATYTYLMNGMHPSANWTGLFDAGERVRLRFINAAAMSYFNVRIPGLPMTVIAADGQAVEAVETDEFQIGTAETYDVIVEPGAEDAYTIMAEAMDRSGYAAGTLARAPGLHSEIPPLRTRPLLTMTDMGMDHMAGAHAAMGDMDNQRASHDHHHMVSPAEAPSLAVNDGHASAHVSSPQAGPVVARHGPDHHGPGNAAVATVQRDRLAERGTGLSAVPHRVLVYADLIRLADDFDPRPPTRELELHLTGNMERYMWSFDGIRFHEVTGPIDFKFGERLRLILVNDTMMNHPIHLHGMWMELENGRGQRLPRKHTINIMPAARVSVLINADAPGRWALHCHLMFHMDMGMFRVVRVS